MSRNFKSDWPALEIWRSCDCPGRRAAAGRWDWNWPPAGHLWERLACPWLWRSPTGWWRPWTGPQTRPLHWKSEQRGFLIVHLRKKMCIFNSSVFLLFARFTWLRDLTCNQVTLVTMKIYFPAVQQYSGSIEEIDWWDHPIYFTCSSRVTCLRCNWLCVRLFLNRSSTLIWRGGVFVLLVSGWFRLVQSNHLKTTTQI